MVFVKVRETYDLHTTQNKMTVIGIHTPMPDIIKRNYPGLLMQCKMYRPYSCDVKIACASVLPLDPLGVGTSEGAVAPEDVFNPILYKAMSNVGMSQLEARINYLTLNVNTGADVIGSSANVDVDTVVDGNDDFNLYYGILSTAHNWKKANPQSGLEMRNLVPIVHEIAYNLGDNNGFANNLAGPLHAPAAASNDDPVTLARNAVIGGSKRLPMINCTAFSGNTQTSPGVLPGFPATLPVNSSVDVPWINCVVGAVIVPPSRRHELFYRMVIEWTLEFSQIRTLGEITNWNGLGYVGSTQHYQNYDFSSAKAATVGSDVPDILDKDAAMVSANVDIQKVM